MMDEWERSDLYTRTKVIHKVGSIIKGLNLWGALETIGEHKGVKTSTTTKIWKLSLHLDN